MAHSPATDHRKGALFLVIPALIFGP